MNKKEYGGCNYLFFCGFPQGAYLLTLFSLLAGLYEHHFLHLLTHLVNLLIKF